MNKIPKLILLGILLVALVAGAAALYDSLKDTVDTNQLATQDTTVPDDTTIDETEQELYPAPDFTVLDANGEAHKLSDFRGKPVVLNFWASWCGPCKSEMPDFQKAYEQYGQEIHFLMVNCTTSGRETMANARHFIASEGYTFPVYFDTTGEAANAYDTYSIPMTYFIDADGNLVAYGQGALRPEILQLGISMIYP